jgi:hypothetical protein
MPNRTDQPAEQPTPADMARQPNQILATPDTVDACQQEYAAGADVRSRLGWKDAS